MNRKTSNQSKSIVSLRFTMDLEFERNLQPDLPYHPIVMNFKLIHYKLSAYFKLWLTNWYYALQCTKHTIFNLCYVEVI